MKFRIWMALALALLSGLLLAGCNQQALIDRMVSKQDLAYAENLFASFPAQDYDGIIAQLDPAVVDANTRAKLQQMAALIPYQKPVSAHVVGVYISKEVGKPAVTRLSLEYQYPYSWLLAQLTMTKQGGKTMVESVYFQPLNESLEQHNRFTLSGRSPKYYAIFALAIAIPLLSVYALIACLRTPMPRLKWLWLLFILAGFMQLSLNWTTGALAFNPAHIQLLGAGALKAGVAGAWVFTISLPLGAILFLLRRKHWIELAQEKEDAERMPMGR